MSGEVIGKEPCPKCREQGSDNSGDNLVRYDDGGAYCFACSHSERSGSSTSEAPTVAPKKKAGLINDLEYRPLVKRGITEETCKHFGYATGIYKGQKVHVAHYRKGDKVAQKVRTKDKQFSFLGDTKDTGFFGQHLWRDGGRQLVITEGELDAMSMSQCQNNKWPVVSVPTGAGGAIRTFKAELEWLESYDKVVLMFDMDEAGQEAAIECAQILSVGKAYIARLPLKDANECILNGKSAELVSAMWDAKAYRPDGVIDISDVCEEACADIEIGRAWPWPSLTEKTYGRRRGELYGFGGGTGCGKSTIFKQVATHILKTEDVPVGMIMLEEQPALTAKTLAGMLMGERLHLPNVEYDKEKLKQTLTSLKGRVYLYDHFGGTDWETIKGKIRYLVAGLGIKDIFLDHLTALAATIEVDERKAIDKIMAELSSLTQELDCTIYYVSHLTTPEGKPHEEGGRVLEKHFRGSRSIAYWSHYMFGVERNKQDLKGVTTFRVLKDRYTGDANGLTFGLEYSKKDGRLTECPIPKKEEPAGHGFKPEDTDEY